MAQQQPTGGDQVDRGREAAAHLDWSAAYEALKQADGSSPLGPDDLVLLATAAYLLGRVDDSLDALQRAYQLLVEDDDRRGAARCGFWLAFLLLNRGEVAQGSGWLARANRLLEEEPEDCPEHGYLLVPVAFQNAVGGNYAAALEATARIGELGNRAHDGNLVAFALHIEGRVRLRQLEVEKGLALLDESMVAVVTGEISPVVAGVIYCSLIDACQEIAELRRAHEWTVALTDWCERQSGMITFTGQCLVHRAEMLHLHGEWVEAEEEAKRAFDRFAHAADQHATGAALYCQAEIQRTKGDYAAADAGYRGATEWGHDPQPGLALLRLAQGRADTAETAIRRALSETDDRTHRAKLLIAQTEILLSAGKVTEARAAADEMEQIAGTYDTPALRADADHARGAVLLAEGDAAAALVHLRRAYEAWRTLEAPYQAARIRVLIGASCRTLGDGEASERELDAASRVFAELGATPDLARVEELQGAHGGDTTHGLTARELEVLRLVARGTTNRAIAEELFVAVKTVDRHVANIFTKLGVSTRAAATAYAYEHELISA